MYPRSLHALTAMALMVCGTPASLAADPCTEFKWDVSREHALFLGKPSILQAGKSAAAMPEIEVNHLYELTLMPQGQVLFAVPPGKTMLTDGAYAGIASFKVRSAGPYRVSVDVPFWIDVIADGMLVVTRDFQGHRGCNAPHKIVEYVLDPGKPLILQVSGSTTSSVHLTVTPSPPPTPHT